MCTSTSACTCECVLCGSCVSLCVCVCPRQQYTIESQAVSCVWVRVDYKGIRISGEKWKRTDYTAALVQPTALRCSPESSVQCWSTYQKSPSFWGFSWKYRKGFILFTWRRCENEQGCVTSPLAPDAITSRSPDDVPRPACRQRSKTSGFTRLFLVHQGESSKVSLKPAL